MCSAQAAAKQGKRKHSVHQPPGASPAPCPMFCKRCTPPAVHRPSRCSPQRPAARAARAAPRSAHHPTLLRLLRLLRLLPTQRGAIPLPAAVNQH